MNKALWTIQILLAAAFLMAGQMKVFNSYATLAQEMSWISHVPESAVRAIGILEIHAAIGLIFPSLFRVQPWLTPLAAAGLVLTMGCATILHLMIGEGALITPNIVLGSMATFVAWGRHKWEPLFPKSG